MEQFFSAESSKKASQGMKVSSQVNITVFIKLSLSRKLFAIIFIFD